MSFNEFNELYILNDIWQLIELEETMINCLYNIPCFRIGILYTEIFTATEITLEINL